MSVFKNQSVKRGHSRGIMIGIILFVLAGIVIAYLLVSAATNRKINEKRAETQDYVNLRSAYAEALAKASGERKGPFPARLRYIRRNRDGSMLTLELSHIISLSSWTLPKSSPI